MALHRTGTSLRVPCLSRLHLLLLQRCSRPIGTPIRVSGGQHLLLLHLLSTEMRRGSRLGALLLLLLLSVGLLLLHMLHRTGWVILSVLLGTFCSDG